MVQRNRYGLFGTDGQAASAVRNLFKPYQGKARELGTAMGGAAGMAAAGPLGSMVGQTLGDKVGGFILDQALPWVAANTIGQITGKGDYRVGPGNYLGRSFSKKRKMKGSSTSSLGATTVVQHRSYIKDIVTDPTGAFKVESFEINPGLAGSFPWLAPIAGNFEQYRIEGMVYEFKSTSGDSISGASTAMGSVVMATEYNVASGEFKNKQEMENHFFGQSAKPSINQLHAIECKDSHTPVDVMFVRTGAVPNSFDKRFYDMGRFSIATVGSPPQGANPGIKVGELWVTYQIRFYKPKINEDGITASNYTNFGKVAESTVGTAVGLRVIPVSATVPSGAVVLRSAGNISLSLLPNGASSNLCLFKNLEIGAHYQINLVIGTASVITAGLAVAIGAGFVQADPLVIFGGGLSVVDAPYPSVAGTRQLTMLIVKATQNEGEISVGDGQQADPEGTFRIDVSISKLDSVTI